jgi:hypothetical protein
LGVSDVARMPRSDANARVSPRRRFLTGSNKKEHGIELQRKLYAVAQSQSTFIKEGDLREIEEEGVHSDTAAERSILVHTEE